jgi:hypothetical protein
MATLIDKTFIVNKDTTNFSNNTIIKKGTIVQGKMSGTMPNGDIRITTNNGEIINYVDLQEQSNVSNAIPVGQLLTTTQQEPVSDFKYYTSLKFLKEASISIVPVGLIGAYCYHKKFSLLKSALLVSIPIVAITGLQYVAMGGGKNKYWGIFVPPSINANRIKQLQLIEKQTGVPQKI